MNKYRHILKELKELFEKALPDNLKAIEDNEIHLAVFHPSNNGLGLWIDFDLNTNNLIVGLGFNHRHLDYDYDNILDGFKLFIKLLTMPILQTSYYKGKRHFKTKYAIVSESEKNEIFGIASKIELAFWRKTISEITEIEPYIDSDVFGEEILKIEEAINKM